METLIQKLESQGVGVIKHNGHFVLKSGDHASDYADFDNAFPHPWLMAGIGQDFADGMADKELAGLVAPAVGGIVLLQWTALGYYRATGRWLNLYWLDKDGTDLVWERGSWQYDVAGQRLWVVEDVVTRNAPDGTIGTTAARAREAGADVAGGSAVIDRKNATAEQLGLPIYNPLERVQYPSVAPDNCSGCDKGIPVVRVGHWESFLEEVPEYPTIAWHEL